MRYAKKRPVAVGQGEEAGKEARYAAAVVSRTDSMQGIGTACLATSHRTDAAYTTGWTLSAPLVTRISSTSSTSFAKRLYFSMPLQVDRHWYSVHTCSRALLFFLFCLSKTKGGNRASVVGRVPLSLTPVEGAPALDTVDFVRLQA